jgi:hypothetical protein
LEFHLTAPTLDSRVVSLNGVPLAVGTDGSLPPMPPKTVTSAAEQWVVAPTSIGFYVFPSVKLAACSAAESV